MGARDTCVVNEAFLKVVFTAVVKSILASKNQPLEFVEVDAFAYNDAGAEKIALFVAFLQGYEAPDKGLDERVLGELIAEVKARELESVVDDISVNLWQYKKGAIAFTPVWEE